MPLTRNKQLSYHGSIHVSFPLLQVSEDLGYDAANSSSECETSLSAESAAAMVLSNITTMVPVTTTRALDGFTHSVQSEVTEADVQEKV